jgi:hypothetical protein
LLIRRADRSEPFTEEIVKNVSLAGVYFETEAADRYGMNDVLITSVAVPESQTRHFPFSRIAGRSRVVRVRELAQPGGSGKKRFGIALEFGDDVTALTAIPARG